MDVLYTSLFLISLIILFLKIKTSHAKQRGREPPGPWNVPILGSLHRVVGRQPPHHAFRELSTVYGPIMSLKLGDIHAVIISSAEAAREILKTHEIYFASRPINDSVNAIFYNANNIIFGRHGEFWREMRRLCTMELLSTKRVRSFRAVREEEVSHLVEFLAASSGGVVNISSKMAETGNNIMARAAIGGRCDDQKMFLSALGDAVEFLSGLTIVDLFPSMPFIGRITGFRRRLEQCQKSLDLMAEKIVEEHREKRAKRFSGNDDQEEDLTDVLLRVQREDSLQFTLSNDNIKAVINDMLMAGSETTSTTLEWAMSEMVRNPTVMKKAQREVREVIGSGRQGKVVDEELISGKLTYLQQVIKETLRLHPPGPLLLPRENQESREIMGYVIPAKTNVMVNMWAIGREENIGAIQRIFDRRGSMRSLLILRGATLNTCHLAQVGEYVPGCSLPYSLWRLFWRICSTILTGSFWETKGRSWTCEKLLVSQQGGSLLFAWFPPFDFLSTQSDLAISMHFVIAIRRSINACFITLKIRSMASVTVGSMELFPAPILIFLTFLFIKSIIKKLDRHRLQSNALVPGPKNLPIIGSIHHLLGRRLPHRALCDLSLIYGPIMRLKLGEIHTIIISSAEGAKEIMQTHDINFASRPITPTVDALFYNGKGLIFASYGEFWCQMRRICTMELLSSKRVHSFRAIIAQEVSHLVRSINLAASAGADINLSSEFANLSNNIMAICVIGSRCEDQNLFQSALRETVELNTGFSLIDLFPSMPNFITHVTGFRQKLERCWLKLDQIMEKIVQEHIEKRTRNLVQAEDLTDVLLKIQQDGNLQFSLSNDNIKAVINNLFHSMLKEIIESTTGFSLIDLFPSMPNFITRVAGFRQKLKRCRLKLDQIMEKIVQEHIEKRARNLVQAEDLTDVLLKIQQDGNLQFSLSNNNVKAVINDILLAGSEAMATTLEWAISELVLNPTIMKKAQREVREVFRFDMTKIMGDEWMSNKLSYLQLVIKETLRLHTPAPLLVPRENKERCKVMGYDIPLRTTVMVNAWAIARDPKYWDKPEYPAKNGEELDMSEAFGISIRRKTPLCLLATPSIPFSALDSFPPTLAHSSPSLSLSLSLARRLKKRLKLPPRFYKWYQSLVEAILRWRKILV
ncbi:hypothetical protein IEQ34_016862 [Dendrobium chrysotoxum]|uniref:Cytochrome P450 n=1 Tax=Dendrobium chrysotoxum TaxID=161865 RepID=A0AAV7GHQ4_DENCH|nr:hypothetical protein IEQ34_016862 [Dendrobium chrysotoxum]